MQMIKTSVYGMAYNKRMTPNPESRDKRVNIDKSIVEMRNMYNNLNDNEFIRWYCSKYNVHSDVVIRAIKQYNKEKESE